MTTFVPASQFFQTRVRELMQDVSCYEMKDHTLVVFDACLNVLPFIQASLDGWNAKYPNDKWTLELCTPDKKPMNLSIRRSPIEL